MIKRIMLRRILLASITLFAIFLITLIPDKKYDQILEYKEESADYATIYLLDSNNYLGKTTIAINNAKVEDVSLELLEALINDGVGESKIPNGFKSFISSETKINSITFNEGLLHVDFSKELLDIPSNLEEKVIESIVYTLTSIDKVKEVSISIDGKILTELPQSKVLLDERLNKTFGINKEYEISSLKDIQKVTIYYVSKYNDKEYYVPVTKYVNDSREKVEIIIDELSSSPIYQTNLMSYLNSNTKLLASSLIDDVLTLNFNNYIYSDIDNKKILEEVLYTISESIINNYEVSTIVYKVLDEEISVISA